MTIAPASASPNRSFAADEAVEQQRRRGPEHEHESDRHGLRRRAAPDAELRARGRSRTGRRDRRRRERGHQNRRAADERGSISLPRTSGRLSSGEDRALQPRADCAHHPRRRPEEDEQADQSCGARGTGDGRDSRSTRAWPDASTGSAETIRSVTSCFSSSFWSTRPKTETSTMASGAREKRTRYAMPAARAVKPSPAYRLPDETRTVTRRRIHCIARA